MDIVWKGVVGGLVTAPIVWASRRGNVLPGILPLAPTFAVIALLAWVPRVIRAVFAMPALPV